MPSNVRLTQMSSRGFRSSHLAAGGVEWHGTTILVVRKNGTTVMIGDGQVSQGSSVMKGNAKKVSYTLIVEVLRSLVQFDNGFLYIHAEIRR